MQFPEGLEETALDMRRVAMLVLAGAAGGYLGYAIRRSPPTIQRRDDGTGTHRNNLFSRMDYGAFATDATFQARLERERREYDAIQAGLTGNVSKLLTHAWRPRSTELAPEDRGVLLTLVRAAADEWKAVDDAWNDASWNACQQQRWQLTPEA